MNDIALSFCCPIECAAWASCPRFPKGQLGRHYSGDGSLNRACCSSTFDHHHPLPQWPNEKVDSQCLHALHNELMIRLVVLNKYFPPDFDPSLIPRRKQPKNSQQVVRLMAPFSMLFLPRYFAFGYSLTYLSCRRCNTCGEYIYKGKKFNARKETVEGEDYYGIKIFRFYIKWCVDSLSLVDLC